AAGRIDQLRGDAYAVSGFADAAFEDITDAEFAADLLHVDPMAFVNEGRVAGDDEQPANAGECRDDLLDHAVGKIFLLRVAAHIREGQHRDRRLVGQRQRCQWALGGGAKVVDPVDTHWPGNVLDLLLAQSLEDEGQPISYVIVNGVGDEHPAGIGQRLDPGSDVDPVTIEVVALDDHVTEIDADAKFDAAVRPNPCVP